QEYERRILAGKAVATRLQANISLDHFERLVKPVRVFALNTGRVDDFIAARRQEPGRRQGDPLSPCSLNKDLRHIKAALAVAVEWGYLPRLPRFHLEREPGALPTYITGDDFALIYKACDVARMRENIPNVSPADWWRAFLVMGYMTGWRVGQLLALKRPDV